MKPEMCDFEVQVTQAKVEMCDSAVQAKVDMCNSAVQAKVEVRDFGTEPVVEFVNRVIQTSDIGIQTDMETMIQRSDVGVSVNLETYPVETIPPPQVETTAPLEPTV